MIAGLHDCTGLVYVGTHQQLPNPKLNLGLGNCNCLQQRFAYYREVESKQYACILCTIHSVDSLHSTRLIYTP